jgi:YD repeat-containing protein
MKVAVNDADGVEVGLAYDAARRKNEVVINIGDDDGGYSVSFTPDEARAMAKHLMHAADLAEALNASGKKATVDNATPS